VVPFLVWFVALGAVELLAAAARWSAARAQPFPRIDLTSIRMNRG
jgi:hypothetical protein